MSFEKTLKDFLRKVKKFNENISIPAVEIYTGDYNSHRIAFLAPTGHEVYAERYYINTLVNKAVSIHLNNELLDLLLAGRKHEMLQDALRFKVSTYSKKYKAQTVCLPYEHIQYDFVTIGETLVYDRDDDVKLIKIMSAKEFLSERKHIKYIDFNVLNRQFRLFLYSSDSTYLNLFVKQYPKANIYIYLGFMFTSACSDDSEENPFETETFDDPREDIYIVAHKHETDKDAFYFMPDIYDYLEVIR